MHAFSVGCRRLVISLGAIAVALVIWRSVPHPEWSRHQPSSTAVRARDGTLLRLTLASDQRYRLWVPLADYPPALVEALALKEDRWFRWHPGVNPVAALRALSWRLSDQESRVGASTLTMQLARIAERLDTQSYRGKLTQMTSALVISASYNKDQVLEAYLNLAPMAGNVEGFATASRIYFGKPVQALNLVEILTLAVLPQRPRLLPHPQGLQLTPAARAARLRLFEDWLLRHPEDARFRGLIEADTVLRRPADLPFLAPHAVDQALRLIAMRGESRTHIDLSLDVALQSRVERILAEFLRQNQNQGFSNGSVLLVDTVDADIRVMIGSADYFADDRGGQINGTQIQRSPGSTLKPMLYGIAIDQGRLHPASVLRDVPTRFGQFSPENFDGEFVGPISAQEALNRSRNIPAVQIASRLQHPNLYDLLRAAEVRNLRRESYYGLSLVLGGGDLSAQELAGLYAMMANQGRHRGLRLLASDPMPPALPLLSPEASFIVRDMLEQHARPDGLRSRLPVAWKTGTSWGFHDAWTAGLFGRYALIVWLGTPDHAAHPNLIGVQAAAPLFFRIVDALSLAPDQIRAPIDSTPLNLRRVAVCQASGELPNADCPKTVPTWFIPGKTAITVSTVHRRVWFSPTDGRPVCGSPIPKGARSAVYAYWPSELRESRLKAGIRDQAPPDLASCLLGAQQAGSAPIIQSPRRTGTYVLGHESDRIGLMASADSQQSVLYWYADGALVGTSRPQETLEWRPVRSGEFLISVSDASGNSQQQAVKVLLSSL
ncbi:penicillin-binding protein 1C [Ahniella affigens]|uniref:peptidoglycan glycosyltransferase n=1 Tax=Ahniella affigens TaxID=2021234 RepID=A0A2P1PQ48_9GAMM|nr:penicillin-binding protein 1C [Ahniella affigens]AVP96969.1 penicillin-binding protein 1C [Ahniella affigens]